jgi:hypothetical protein
MGPMGGWGSGRGMAAAPGGPAGGESLHTKDASGLFKNQLGAIMDSLKVSTHYITSQCIMAMHDHRIQLPSESGLSTLFHDASKRYHRAR